MRKGAFHERQVSALRCCRIGRGDRRAGASCDGITLRWNLSKLRHALPQRAHLFRKPRHEGILADAGDNELQNTGCRRESPVGCLRANDQLRDAYEMAVKLNRHARAAETDRAGMAVDAWRPATGADVNEPLLSAGRRAAGSESSGAAGMGRRGQRRRLSGPGKGSHKTRHGGQSRDRAKVPECPAHTAGEPDHAEVKAGARSS